jgi:rubredoxin
MNDKVLNGKYNKVLKDEAEMNNIDRLAETRAEKLAKICLHEHTPPPKEKGVFNIHYYCPICKHEIKNHKDWILGVYTHTVYRLYYKCDNCDYEYAHENW